MAKPVTQVSQSAREERVKMSKLRQVISKRLKEHNTAMLTTFNEVDMSSVMAVRNEYKDVFEKKQWHQAWFYVVLC